MKKSLLAGIAASVMLFSACSSSEEVAQQTVSTDNQIQLQLNNGGAGLKSRAARDLYTTANADNVDHVTLKLYRYDAGEWVPAEGEHFDNEEIAWDNTIDVDPTDNLVTNIIKLKNLNENTKYKVVAYGYNGTPCPYTVNMDGDKLVASNVPEKVEELFAGVSKDFMTDGDGLVQDLITVKMDRMVAGLLAYFYNIPIRKIQPGTTDVVKVVRYINVYACAKSNAFIFPSNGQYNGENQVEERTKLVDFDLKEWVANYDEQVAASEKNISAMFVMDAFKKGTVSTLPNSVIKGCFIVPFKSHVDTPTLMIELADEDNTVLKHWDVTNNKNKAFDIQRNYFYGLGKKVFDAATLPGEGEDPNDPDSPADNPMDMSSVDFAISLNDAWSQVIYMTFD